MNPGGLIVVVAGALMVLIGVRGTHRNVLEALKPA